MLYKVIDDFILEEKVSEELINKYTGKIPEQLLEVWKQYGFGSILNGYLKIVNPDEFQSLLKDVYFRSEGAIPLFATSMGDILIWEDNRYLMMLNFRKGTMKGITAGLKYFFFDLEEEEFMKKNMEWKPYPAAVERYGVPDYDECFGYAPILGLGGPEKVENLSKVKLVEHIYLITQFMGAVE